LAAEVGLLAHSSVGVAYELRDKMGMSRKPALHRFGSPSS
jgi:hypothetical protein